MINFLLRTTFGSSYFISINFLKVALDIKQGANGIIFYEKALYCEALVDIIYKSILKYFHLKKTIMKL